MAFSIKKYRDQPEKLFENADEGAAQEYVLTAGCNALLVIHSMTEVTDGGYVSLELLAEASGTAVDHHGEGTGIKSDDADASYTCVFKVLSSRVKITLNVTDGTHNVWVIPCVV